MWFQKIVLTVLSMHIVNCAQFHAGDFPFGIDQMKDYLIESTYTESDTHCAWLCHNKADCGSFVFMEQDCNRFSHTSEYSGKVSTTITGRDCQLWNDSFPWNHTYKQDSFFPDGSVERARNYCRDPGSDGYLWCYTTDPAQMWEPCDVLYCDNTYEHLKDICGPANHKAYVGDMNRPDDTACQRWDSQYPHRHTNTNPALYPDESITAAENYCRDPDNSGFLWCYTSDPAKRWIGCDVPVCENVVQTEACYPSTIETYTGSWGWTITGKKCQSWSSQTPHNHTHQDADFPDASIEEAGNFCRDPTSEGFLWCYTTDLAVKREPCGMPKCKPHSDCRPGNVRGYVGSWNTSASGQSCAKWSDMTPTVNSSMFPYDKDLNSVANYCRDPTSTGSLWCYTEVTTPEMSSCDLIPCNERGKRCRLYSNALSGTGTVNREGFKFYGRV